MRHELLGDKDVDLYESHYSDSKGSTVLYAYLTLFLRIRDLAIRDGRYDDFKEYWVHRTPMPLIWESLDSVLSSGGSTVGFEGDGG